MRNISLIALKNIPNHKAGETFLANHVEAKALIALRMADHHVDQTYMTRDMAAGQPRPEAPQASDTAKKLAEERGIDLSTVTGTGRNGRITLKDVEAA